ncbi:hypothetical protein [Acidomonas methanolica]|uniref:hypothetical protein n=1 Tax=Acidomonas methanolica TaxID=437 RepID=UPI00211A87C4|nr:hypothetical protein [Acidomonas methanolica]MCQ9155323.1 hypothetical protein [Acidomonas methanolica]
MAGLDIGQLKHMVVAPMLASMGLDGAAAVNLLAGTALAESGAMWLRQKAGGPALGLWQMEPATHDDCWVNFLDWRRGSHLYEAVLASLGGDIARCGQLVSNLRYACAMARVKYYRAPPPLPRWDDPVGQALYHKSWYNTALGAADATANVPLFRQAIRA